MKGVYQHCPEKHLHRYLSEFDSRRVNRRHQAENGFRYVCGRGRFGWRRCRDIPGKKIRSPLFAWRKARIRLVFKRWRRCCVVACLAYRYKCPDGRTLTIKLTRYLRQRQEVVDWSWPAYDRFSASVARRQRFCAPICAKMRGRDASNKPPVRTRPPARPE
jgi:hypothetical protein